MMITAAIARLQLSANRFDESERPRFDPPATANQLHDLEQRFGSMPNDLRTFLLATSQVIAMEVHNGYWLGGDVLLDPHPDQGLPGRVATPTGDVPVVAVATDGGGNAFLLSFELGTVWQWDHETGRTRSVAGSFTEFLLRVAEDWDHYASGDPNWQFLV